MFQIIVVLSFTLWIGWLVNDKFKDIVTFFTPVSSVKVVRIVESAPTQNPPFCIVPTDVNQTKEEAKTSSLPPHPLVKILKENRFYDAFSFYLNQSENEVSRLMIEHYLTNLAQKEPHKALEWMNVFREDVPENTLYPIMLQLYLSQKDFTQALSLIEEEREDYISEARDENLSKAYEEVLEKRRQSKIKKHKGYDYVIDLDRYGEHFAVKVWLDGVVLILMLDTGATYIFVDEAKASHLEVVRTEMMMQTAGETIEATLTRANLMQIGALELSSIEVVTAPFERQGIDGLLGMNFFKRFEFVINQEEAKLYLKEK